MFRENVYETVQRSITDRMLSEILASAKVNQHKPGADQVDEYIYCGIELVNFDSKLSRSARLQAAVDMLAAAREHPSFTPQLRALVHDVAYMPVKTDGLDPLDRARAMRSVVMAGVTNPHQELTLWGIEVGEAIRTRAPGVGDEIKSMKRDAASMPNQHVRALMRRVERDAFWITLTGKLMTAVRGKVPAAHRAEFQPLCPPHEVRGALAPRPDLAPVRQLT